MKWNVETSDLFDLMHNSVISRMRPRIYGLFGREIKTIQKFDNAAICMVSFVGFSFITCRVLNARRTSSEVDRTEKAMIFVKLLSLSLRVSFYMQSLTHFYF